MSDISKKMPGLNIALQSISSRINRLPNDLKSEIASYINFCDICGKSGASELHGTLYWSCAREKAPFQTATKAHEDCAACLSDSCPFCDLPLQIYLHRQASRANRDKPVTHSGVCDFHGAVWLLTSESQNWMAMKMETGERNLSSTWWKTSPAPSGRHEVPLKRQRCLCHVVNSRVQPPVGVRLPISFHLKNLAAPPRAKKGKVTPNGRWPPRGVCGNRSRMQERCKKARLQTRFHVTSIALLEASRCNLEIV